MSDPQSVAGKKALPLAHALAERVPIAGIEDVQLRGPERLLVAGINYRRDRARWRRGFGLSPLAFRLQSLRARRALASQPNVELALQLNGLFRTHGRPYAVYTDVTYAVSRRAPGQHVPKDEGFSARWQGLERDLYLGALHLFAQSELTRASLVEDYGVPEERITVVYAGANVPLQRRERPPTGAPAILFVGRDPDHKGLPLLLRAFSRVRAVIPAARLVVVGPERIDTRPGVEHHGFVRDRAEVSRLYREASVFALPSSFEAFGLSALEALGSSCPAVVTRVGALPEVVRDEIDGLVVPREDESALTAALVRVLEDPELATRMGRAGHRRVAETFTWTRVAERMEPALSRALRSLSLAD